MKYVCTTVRASGEKMEVVVEDKEAAAELMVFSMIMIEMACPDVIPDPASTPPHPDDPEFLCNMIYQSTGKPFGTLHAYPQKAVN